MSFSGKKSEASLWFAPTPGKSWCEKVFLVNSVVWIVWALCIVVPFGVYEVLRRSLELPSRAPCKTPMLQKPHPIHRIFSHDFKPLCLMRLLRLIVCSTFKRRSTWPYASWLPCRMWLCRSSSWERCMPDNCTGIHQRHSIAVQFESDRRTDACALRKKPFLPHDAIVHQACLLICLLCGDS